MNIFLGITFEYILDVKWTPLNFKCTKRKQNEQKITTNDVFELMLERNFHQNIYFLELELIIKCMYYKQYITTNNEIIIFLVFK